MIWHRDIRREKGNVKYWITAKDIVATLVYSDFAGKMDIRISNVALGVPLEDRHMVFSGKTSLIDEWNIDTLIRKVNEIIESKHPEWLHPVWEV